MKKNYIAPAILVQPINMDNLLAGSFGNGSSTNNATPTSDHADNQFSKKHYNIWGDDEE